MSDFLKLCVFIGSTQNYQFDLDCRRAHFNAYKQHIQPELNKLSLQIKLKIKKSYPFNGYLVKL